MERHIREANKNDELMGAPLPLSSRPNTTNENIGTITGTIPHDCKWHLTSEHHNNGKKH